MSHRILSPWLIAWSGIALCLLVPMHAFAQQRPPYQILLRDRTSEAVPEHNRDGQTGAGLIEVVQRGPDTIQVLMRGSVLAGSETQSPGSAALRFLLNQNFEIVPTRAGLRAPRLSLTAHLIGTLQVSLAGGTAEQGPACASINSDGQPILDLCINPHSAAACQRLFINDQTGPREQMVVAGKYCLHQTFSLTANAPPPVRTVLPKITPAAGAVFDAFSKPEGPWTYVLRDFRTLPRRDFGFLVLLQVSESSPSPFLPAPLNMPVEPE